MTNRSLHYVWLAALGVVSFTALVAHPNKANADQVFRQCDRDGDDCQYVECDRDGDDCRPVSSPYYSRQEYYPQRQYYQPPALSFSWGYQGYNDRHHRHHDDDDE